MFIALSILIAAIFLTILVSVHEAGHMFAAKFFKVKVEEFGIGFPPKIWGKKKGETTYTVNLIPAGGFVRLYGEDGEATEDPRSFAAKGPWVRALIIVAGVIVNFVIAFLLFGLLVASNGFRADMPLTLPFSGETLKSSFPFGQQTNKALIEYVVPNSPAEKAGFQAVDVIESANGQTFDSVTDFQKFIEKNKGKTVTFELYNMLDRSTRVVEVIPRVNPPKDEGALGVLLGGVATIRYQSVVDKVFVGVEHSTNTLFFQAQAIGSLISQSVKEKSAEPVSENVRGPVGIVTLLGIFIGRTGISAIWSIVEILAVISLVLAVVNILPIPAMDGGRFFFALFEGVTKRKVNQRFERLVHTTGFVLLILLFLAITYNDIINIIKGF